MTGINCGVDSCSYNKSGSCYAPSISIGGKGATASSDTVCGSYLNKSAYSNIAEFTSMRGSPQAVACMANTCSFNSGGLCSKSSITVGQSSFDNSYYTGTQCNSFRQ